jgi:hypothetical protein
VPRFVVPVSRQERLGGVKIRRRSSVRDEARSFHDVFDGVRLGIDRLGSQGETSPAGAPREQRAAACREQQHAGTAH